MQCELLGGPYESLAGHDASRALATFSMDEAAVRDSWDTLEDLSEDQVKGATGWNEEFRGMLPLTSFHSLPSILL